MTSNGRVRTAGPRLLGEQAAELQLKIHGRGVLTPAGFPMTEYRAGQWIEHDYIQHPMHEIEVRAKLDVFDS